MSSYANVNSVNDSKGALLSRRARTRITLAGVILSDISELHRGRLSSLAKSANCRSP